MIRLRSADRRDRTGGQGLIEFALIVPVFMLLLLGLLEFGFVFDHTMTLNYATREGARSGAAFAAGNNTTMVCNATVDVDKNIIAAVQRVLEAPGSQVDVARVSRVRIFKANATGGDTGQGNNWVPGTGPVVDGQALHFSTVGSADMERLQPRERLDRQHARQSHLAFRSPIPTSSRRRSRRSSASSGRRGLATFRSRTRRSWR